MKLFKIIGVTLATALLLAGCSGGTLSGTNTKTGGGGSTVASIPVTPSVATIAADGSTSATVTAQALDANNVAVSGVAVTWAASAGGVLTPVSTTTDSSGKVTATVSAAPGTAANTVVTIKATAGTITGAGTVTVVQIQQSLTVTTNAPQIPSDSTSGATITALLRDANNNVLPGVTVSFNPSSGAITKTTTTAGGAANPPVPAGVTDANGVASAVLTAGGDPTDRVITVTVNAGTAAPANLPVSVVGTTLVITGPANLVQGNQGVYNVLLSNSASRGIPGVTVGVTSANGNTVMPATAITDANGQANFTLTATSVANSGADTLTASALGLLATRALTVSSQNFSITTPATASTQVDLGVVQPIVATWLSNGAAVVGQTVNFASTRGTLSASSAVTDATGKASVTISSTTAGPAVINASGTGVTAQTGVDFVATSPTQIAVQASPAAVAVQSTSTVTATVRDAQNNLVESAVVTFSLTDSTGGQLSVASATTDAQGRAQTTYTAGNTTSAANGVIVTASVQGTNPVVSGTVDLTVGGQTVFLSLGTGNQINAPDQATYYIQYAVLALDAQGAAVANVPVTVKVLPINYVKGGRVYNGTTWATIPSTPTNDPDASPAGTQTCANEDTDYTGNISSLDPAGPLPMCTNLVTNQSIQQHKKDYNCNGILDPGNVAAVSPASGNTDANGELIINVTYPKDHAYYVTVQLVASTSVAGTQSSTSSTFLLPGLANDFNSGSVAPPGVTSPYGQATSCANPL